MALFESYDRRIDQINAVLATYGIASIEEAKQIQRVAEDNARRAVIDAVTPRIKALIERRLTEDAGDAQAMTEPVLATSDPAAPMTTPTVALAMAGASLTPSPIMAT